MSRFTSLLLLLLLAPAGAPGEGTAAPAPQPPRRDAPVPPAASPRPTPAVDIADAGRPATHVFNVGNGLPQNAVNTIVLDHNRYLWVGTQDGAACYNGRTWTAVNMPDRRRSNYVEALMVRSDGSLWFGTFGNGIHRLENGIWSSYSTASGLPNNRIHCLLETTADDGSRIVWAGTDGGLARFEGGQWITGAVERGLPSKAVLTLLETRDEDGTAILWAGMADGLGRLHGGHWTLFTPSSSGLPSSLILSLLETRSDDGASILWVGTDGGLARYERGRWSAYDTSSGLPHNSVESLLETRSDDGASTLWAGTNGGGLARLRGGAWTVFNSNSGLPGNTIWSLFETGATDGRRALWVGTQSGGLARMDFGGWTSFDTRLGLPSAVVWSFAETPAADGGRALWVGTDGGGIARFAAGQWTVFDTSSGLPHNTVMCMLASTADDGSSVLLAGTDGGLARFEKGRWTVFDASSGVTGKPIRSLLETKAEDGSKVLWVGTSRGVGRFERGQWTVYDASSGLPHDSVRSLYETRGSDGASTIWAGTNGGLGRFERGQWTAYTTASSGLPNDRVSTMLERRGADGTRVLWIGTGGGVAHCSLDTPEPVLDTLHIALPTYVVSQLREDAWGRIYIFTFKGIVRLTPRAPTPEDASEYESYTFTTADGLPSDGVSQGASMVDSAGRIWAGTLYGAAMLDPSREVADRSPKPLHIERVVVNNTEYGRPDQGGQEAGEVAGSGPIGLSLNDASLDHSNNNLTFEYALLSFSGESHTRYRTQLVGFENEPTDWSAEPKRVYANLGEGQYTFRVWGRDNAGNVTGPVLTTFRIRPAPWRTWWAYLFYATAIGLLGYGGVRLRVQSLWRQNQRLEAKVAARTARIQKQAEQLKRSEAKAHETELRALDMAKKALEANRAKSIFLSSMSHELRTPLNAVLGFAQLMERDGELTRAQRENLAIIMQSGEHLLGLINDVLSISKIEAGKLTLVEGVFDLHRLLRAVEEMIRTRAESKNLWLEFCLDADLPTAVQGDEGKLRQVLLNLLGNAVKFTSAGGVTLRASWADGRASFEVEDTGQGIPEGEIGHLFEPFVQTTSGQQAREGTGLGLVISRSIVRMMGGDIGVRSRFGVGTIFSFEVDLSLAGEVERVEEQPRVIGLEPGQEPFRILVVDDTLENRILLTKLLRSVGFEVCEACDGREAVEVWSAWDPHLIWMDMRMPVMDGYSAARHIRRVEAEVGDRPRRTAIVALTASAFEHDRSKILASGCDDFVAKPYREAVIFDKLAERLGVQFLRDEAGRGAFGGAPEASLAATDRLAAMPEDWIVDLRQAAVRGSTQMANRAIDRMRERDESLAAELGGLVSQFAFETILDLIGENGNDRHGEPEGKRGG